MAANKLIATTTFWTTLIAPAAPQCRLVRLLEARAFERPVATMYGRREGRISERLHGGYARHDRRPRRRAIAASN